MERPIDIVEQGIYIEPNVFNNDSEYELFHSYLESQKYIEWLETELKKLRVADVSNRREQLIAFADAINICDGNKEKIRKLVDLYIKSN